MLHLDFEAHRLGSHSPLLSRKHAALVQKFRTRAAPTERDEASASDRQRFYGQQIFCRIDTSPNDERQIYQASLRPQLLFPFQIARQLAACAS
eukprot:TRINITY_DN12150_c0_g1_i1.p3 TRINITY_DN12150_c0_g1~~TRINITY_DN12150_c0_g1_i1.p3  ORF type:complete len:104 (+),score=0.94 TRINITY_DN12150_c0_g1_i1:36-314(+)